MRAELHCHTTASDGVHTPEELVRLAARLGLAALAITDHDTTAGLQPAQACARELGVELIPGIEISCYKEREVHVLGYFFDPLHPGLGETMARMCEARVERVGRMLELLDEAGVPLSFEAVKKQAGGGSMGRPHVARALVAAGFVRGFEEAFDRLLGAGKPAYVPRTSLTPADAVGLLCQAGGVAVLAHPGLYRDHRLVMDILAEGGFAGLEVYHPCHDGRRIRRYRRLAGKLGLIATGGSDYHGLETSGTPPLGQIELPPGTVERLRRAAQESRRESSEISQSSQEAP